MEINHLSDEDIQAYAMTPQESPESIVLHIRSCAQCIEQVNIYKWIFAQSRRYLFRQLTWKQ